MFNYKLKELLAAEKQCSIKLFSGLKTMEKSRLKTALRAIGVAEVVEDSEELFKRGERWYGGCGERVDYTKAVQCFEQASEAGHAAATAALRCSPGAALDASKGARGEICLRVSLDRPLTAWCGSQRSVAISPWGRSAL